MTVMLTVPRPGEGRGEAGEELITILPVVFEEMTAALPAPKSTAVAAAKLVPRIVTLVPPVGSPVGGETEVMVGTPAAPAGVTPTTVRRNAEGADAQRQCEHPLCETQRTHNQRVQPVLGHRTSPPGPFGPQISPPSYA